MFFNSSVIGFKRSKLFYVWIVRYFSLCLQETQFISTHLSKIKKSLVKFNVVVYVYFGYCYRLFLIQGWSMTLAKVSLWLGTFLSSLEIRSLASVLTWLGNMTATLVILL